MHYNYNFCVSTVAEYLRYDLIGVEWSLLGAIGIHCAYYFTYIPYNYQ